ncbi:MAG: ATP synthase subunit C [Pseudomonadota bacterium]
MKASTVLSFATLALAGMVAIVATVLLIATPADAAQAPAAVDPGVARWAFAAAAAAAALSAAAAGYAVAQVGSAAVGAIAEKPELFGRLLILVGLAEGIAISGLIVAVLIFNRIGG